ncbi:unnamed protein product [Amoebophrya sp. A120]|nr:unnamed protein product [Amoebophrya sp. A120]|eukprot:GSA120T00017058001.1
MAVPLSWTSSASALLLLAVLCSSDELASPQTATTGAVASPIPPDEDERNLKFREKYEYCQGWTQSMDQALSLKIMSLEKEVYEVRKLLRDFAVIENAKNREYMQTLETHASSIESVRQGIFDRLERERIPFALEQKLAELTPRDYCPENSYLMRLGDQFAYCTSAVWHQDVNIKNYGPLMLDCDHSSRIPQDVGTYVVFRSSFYAVPQCALKALLVLGHMVTLKGTEEVRNRMETQLRLNEAMFAKITENANTADSLRNAVSLQLMESGGEDEKSFGSRAQNKKLHQRPLNCTRPALGQEPVLENFSSVNSLIQAGKFREALENFVWNPTQFIQPSVFVEAQKRVVGTRTGVTTSSGTAGGPSAEEMNGSAGEQADDTSENNDPGRERDTGTGTRTPDSAFIYLIPRLLYLQHLGTTIARKFFPVACQEFFLDSCDDRPRSPLGYAREVRIREKEKYFLEAAKISNPEAVIGDKAPLLPFQLLTPSIPFPEQADFDVRGETDPSQLGVLFAIHGVGYSVFPSREAFERVFLDFWTQVDYVGWCHGDG